MLYGVTNHIIGNGILCPSQGMYTTHSTFLKKFLSDSNNEVFSKPSKCMGAWICKQEMYHLMGHKIKTRWAFFMSS